MCPLFPELDAYLTKRDHIFSEQQLRDIIAEVDLVADQRIDFMEFCTIQYELAHPKKRDARKAGMKSHVSTALSSMTRSAACTVQ